MSLKIDHGKSPVKYVLFKKKYVYAAMWSLELIGRKATLFMCKFFNGNADFCMYFQNIS